MGLCICEKVRFFSRIFKLYLYDEGFVVQMPEAADPEKIHPFQPQNKLFPLLKE